MKNKVFKSFAMLLTIVMLFSLSPIVSVACDEMSEEQICSHVINTACAIDLEEYMEDILIEPFSICVHNRTQHSKGTSACATHCNCTIHYIYFNCSKCGQFLGDDSFHSGGHSVTASGSTVYCRICGMIF
ncbi:MAG: hypothetical protein FWC09_06040 [Lachnospiraceae bacterium]|nr:hypothetical protein [Lachnospiraceae bacterium]